MERSDFNEALEDRSRLRGHSKEEWEVLVQKYPYATLLHLLQAQGKESLSAADKKRLLLHFENPFHLSTNLAKAALVKEDEKQEAATIADEVSKESANETTPAIKPVEEAVTSQATVEATPKTQPKEDVKKSETDDTEDVLELINQLPEESPIKRKEEVDEEEKEKLEEPVQDPGDLMVMMSFTDWLNHFKAKSEHEAEEKKGKDAIRSAWQKEKLAEAMDDEEDVVPDEIFEKAMKSVSFGDGLVTEPLAEVYVRQGKIEQAIELYKKLSLLNPEKRTYFASRIKDLHLLK